MYSCDKIVPVPIPVQCFLQKLCVIFNVDGTFTVTYGLFWVSIYCPTYSVFGLESYEADARHDCCVPQTSYSRVLVGSRTEVS